MVTDVDVASPVVCDLVQCERDCALVILKEGSRANLRVSKFSEAAPVREGLVNTCSS